jgi:hypothetical protein
MHRHPLRQVLRFSQAVIKRLVTGLLQLVLLAYRPTRLARSGFVLPTTVLLVIMVVLTATALTYRSFTRSDMAISQREQQVISNAATPAIDRAKAKIEFLFQTDNRFPSGVPASDILADLMQVTSTFAGYTGRVPTLAGTNDPYTLPDEQRVDINGDGTPDNAWSFTTDINGDGVVDGNELVVYSILVDDIGSPSNPTNVSATAQRIEDRVTQNKADALITRTGPLATTEASPACAGSIAEGGWQVVQQGNNSILQKNFQVNAFVANLNDANRTFETLEFQQSRSAARANKWGAWFRYDLDVSPGPEFNWNGAMHTDGNLFAISSGYRSHMVSSHNSCLYSQEASEISLSEIDLNGDGVATPGTVVNGQQEFQGQAVRGTVRFDNTTSGSNPRFHVWNGAGVAARINLNLTNTRDSVRTNGGNNNARPSDIAMNPMLLFTQDVAQHINPGAWQRDPNWETNNTSFASDQYQRIINDQVARPFVDDFFRADNRWGPKPRYDSRDPSLDAAAAGATIGNNITSLGRLTDEAVGLDGYWERQAIATGLRLIMGQRLELGNSNGWNADPLAGTAFSTADTQGDPLYPARVKPAANGRFGGPHEYLQRKALRDNLAAVQGMTVYHYQINSGTFPAACMAMTAHPGTAETILNSRTFSNYPVSTTRLRADFLNGTGTNGWEFQFPAAFDTETEFATQVAIGNPLGNALRNLAYFAGDPAGGAPSFSPVQDVASATASVHPAPYLTMWGDYSPLRRIFTEYLDASPAVAYANLSPADKATLHSAACNVSLLAYNVESDYVEARAVAGQNPGSINFQNIASQLRNAMLGLSDYLITGANNINLRAGYRANDFFTDTGKTRPWTDSDINNAPCINGITDLAGYQPKCDFGEYFAEYTLDDWITLLRNATNATPAEIDLIVNYFNQVSVLTSTIRDRELGFREGIPTTSLSSGTTLANNVTWDPLTGITQQINMPGGVGNRFRFTLRCDPNLYGNAVAGGVGGQDDVAVLGYIGCSASTQMPIRYPSLFYLFPLAQHDFDGDGATQQPDGTLYSNPSTPTVEEYINDAYVRSVNPPGSATVIFRRVGSGTDPVFDVAGLAALPRSATASSWTVPASTTSTTAGVPTAANISDRAQAFKIIAPGGGTIRVPFLDKGVYNGREQLNTRVLDLDIDALTTRRATAGGDFWLSANLDNRGEGVVYAFREDNVREDTVTRPRNATGSVDAVFCQALNTATPRRFNIETQANCQMQAEPGTTVQDPPLTNLGISLKPVDFYPDPERRVNGFRLRTESGNPADFSGTSYARQVGMTFVTDNAVYIQGDFNPHSTTGLTNAIIEEFTQTLYDKTLGAAFGLPFYNNRTTLNTNTFATYSTDHWRTVEILADAVSILSGTFRDGAVEDSFVLARPGNEGGGNSSYMIANRPTLGANQLNWVRENAVTGAPVWVDRNGTYYRNNTGSTPDIQPFYAAYNDDDDWTGFNTNVNQRRRNLQSGVETFVDATVVSGLVPERPNQGYGGLHNFPRFLEDWQNIELHIAGSLIQLNFSTNATGPFEHDAWEPTANPNNNEELGYYRPPLRRWGYDVGLLYVPPAPAARRFVNIGAPRSEYYRELPADDPYIVNLRCAEDASGNRILGAFCTKA